MNSEEIPQRIALQLQLAAIAGREPTSSYFEIRFKLLAGSGMRQDFIPLNEVDRASRAIRNRGQVSDTYVGVAPRTERKGTTDAIARIHCLHADCDGLESLEQLSAFRPLPSIVIRSGSENAVHAYWPLREPVPPTWAQRGNRRLALALGADRNATDPARILRPAATFNFKHDPPRPVVCTRLELDVYTFADVVGHLADDPRYLTLPRPRGPITAVSPSKALDALLRTVTQAQLGNRNSTLFWAACRLREHTDASDIDGVAGRNALRDAALAAGLSEAETDRTLDSALHATRDAA